MVRTLDFHSNNVGSIPASLNINSKIFFYNDFKKLTKIKKLKKKIKYSFTFSSIISPSSINNIRLILNYKINKSKNKKLLVKQSYLLFT